MCKSDSKPGSHLSPAEKAVSSSRRKRLWDLSRDTHCPVVGVCIPLSVLRRLVSKVLGGVVQADDYEVHVGAIAECGHRNRMSETLQEDLDRRYALTIKRFRAAKSAEALTQLWLEAIYQGDVAGAFWAGLTHPMCDTGLQEGMCRDMHMLQHQAGATVRADIVRFNALLEENAVLGREMGRHQERHARLMQDKTNEVDKLQQQVLQLRAENIGKDSVIAYLTNDLQQLRDAVPELESKQKLQQKITQMQHRQQELEQQVRELKQKQVLAEKAQAVETQAASTIKEDSAPQRHRTIPIALQLQQRNVLCVGGRSGNVSSYRDLIERVGRRFIHHDGGMEDNSSLLESSLAAADLVICQTGCISHSAYWRVKEFCKRTGKRCVFVENPSVSSLARGLQQATRETDALPIATSSLEAAVEAKR